jgi:hypothetical protein
MMEEDYRKVCGWTPVARLVDLDAIEALGMERIQIISRELENLGYVYAFETSMWDFEELIDHDQYICDFTTHGSSVGSNLTYRFKSEKDAILMKMVLSDDCFI